ncbi:thioredoxin-like protein CITRX, chloroplastic-like [Dorcoceras hygrometricum]|uniref:Thioredoxin-like protein CITRX, chloroplastic-like n=1 Tax=Dorcoceras hygrometricum TaxID=472368 RepID=A0A2Z7C4X0_9LAMI|nr:thioredoxin-like protein CITRX, chloroplastic-like [Dorcoceras hygrometricum]
MVVGDNGGSGSRFPGAQRKLKFAPRYAPGSDQFHKETVTSKALTAYHLHSMKTSEPKAQQFLALWLMVKGYTDPSTYTPDPSSVERAHGSSAAHSPFFWGPS